MQRPSFDKEYLSRELGKVASKITKPVTLFIIGGGGLAFYGLKEATKDIDVIMQNPDESSKRPKIQNPKSSSHHKSLQRNAGQ